MPVAQDYSNQRFGMSICLRLSGNKKGKAFLWFIQCDCGQIFEGIPSNVRGHVRNGFPGGCGCGRRTNGQSTNLSPIERLYRNIVYRSQEQRGIEFLLSVQEYDSLIKQPCFYCNAQPGNTFRQGKIYLRYQGLDRIDSFTPYTLANVVPCCKICNSMKGSLSCSAFLEHLKKVLGHMESKNVE